MYLNHDLGGARWVASQPFTKITIDLEPCVTMLLEKLLENYMYLYVNTHAHTRTHTHTHTTDMATPALSRFGSAELKKEFLAPSVAGDMVACLGVSEVGSGSDVASIKTTAVPKKGQLIF